MRKKLLIIVLMLTSIIFADLGNMNSYVFVGDTLSIFNDQSDIIKIIPVQDNIINIRVLPGGAQDSMTLVMQDYQKNGVAQLNNDGDKLVFSTSRMMLEINKSPIKMNLSTDRVLIFDNSDVSGFSDNNFTLGIDNSDYYGLHNRNQGDLNNPPDGQILAGDQGEAGAPFVWTPEGWGMLVDTYRGLINLNSSTLSYDHDQTTGQDLNIYFISGQPLEIFQGMTYLSGRPPLFPKFTYGFLNTEWGIDQQELLNDIRRYRKEEIPIDAYILDYDWMAYGEDNYGEFRWDQEKFPDAPSGALKDSLQEYGLKLMGIRKPRIRVNSVQGQYCQDNDLFVDFVTDYFTGQEVGRLDFRKKQARDWYWNSFWDNGAFQKGLIGYWNDEADVYGGNLMFMQMQRSNYEGQRRATDQRVWSINRNFFLGSQRYAYAHWSGDIGTSFESMAEQRLFMLSSINLGSSWWGMDIGGFQGTPTPENYIRWIQFGAFVPVFRVHGTNGQEREPWNYGPEAVKIARKYINMRYALMPYIYTQAYQNYKEGQPIVRPLVMDYPDDLQVRNMYSEWMFGDNFLVRPVVSENADQVNVYLPEGEWIDFNRGHRYSGSQYIGYPVNLEDIPVFVKAGSVIPMKEPGDYVDDPETKQALYWHVFPGPTGFFTLYEDNGWYYNYEGRGYSLSQATQHTNPEEITFNLGDRSFPYDPPERSLFAVFRLITAEPDQVELDGENLHQREPDSLENYIRAWAFQKTGSRVLVKFPDDGLKHKVVLTKGEDTNPPAIDTVSVLDQNSVQLVFDEAVQAGNAENFDSYSFEPDLRINSIQLEQDQRTVKMNCSDLEINQDYKITIKNIADTSSNQNILSDTSLIVAYRPFGDYSWVLQNGLVDYSGCSDTHISENQPDNNMGGYEFFECCRFAGDLDHDSDGEGDDDKHALVKFDLQSLASEIDSLKKAELILTLARTRNGSPDKTIASYRITKNWQEGNTGNNIDGNYASDGEVTWTHARFNQEEWQTQGGDYCPDYSDLVSVGSTAGTNLSWEVTDFVKFWINKPDSNFGVLLKEPTPSTENGTIVFYSSEHDIQKFRPKLGLIYGDDQVAIASQSLNQRPDEFHLQQNYPNPFNPRASIAYQIPAEGQVKLEIFNLLGQKVTTLVDNYQKPGRYKTVWQAGENSSGIYIYRLSLVNGSQRFFEQKKMILMK